MARILGLVQCNWRGSNVPVEKGSKVTLGGMQQKAVVIGMQVDYTSEYKESTVEVTTRLAAGDSLYATFTPGPGPLIITCDTGQTYSWDDATISNLPGFTAGDGGKVAIHWFAGEAAELVNASSNT